MTDHRDSDRECVCSPEFDKKASQKQNMQRRTTDNGPNAAIYLIKEYC